jgi:hypothetical protein
MIPPRLVLALILLAAPAAAQVKVAPPAASTAAPADADADADKVKTTSQVNRESLEGAATAPLRDLNMLRTKIPKVLLEAMADPYARPPKNFKCAQLIALVQPLENALGPDIDRIPIEDEDYLDRGRQAAFGAAADYASDAIPFRNWVRRLTGAERHDKMVRDAIISGGVRRAYLKGLGEAKGCNPPATPSHEKAGSPVPSVDKRFTPRFPTRASPDAPQSPAGTPPSAPRK